LPHFRGCNTKFLFHRFPSKTISGGTIPIKKSFRAQVEDGAINFRSAKIRSEPDFLRCTKKVELTAGVVAVKVGFVLSKGTGCVGGSEPRAFAKQESRWGERAMKSMEWKTYRTRFLVKAKQLNSSLSFVDALGRQHSGRKGDYLVESSDGVISITPRRIFEDVYVPLLAEQELTSSPNLSCGSEPRKAPQPYRETLNPQASAGMVR
jgi:hypothetical protein